MPAADARLSAPEPLTSDHDSSDFDSGEIALDDWLKHRALKNESRYARTYVVCRNQTVIGYYCISAGAVERSVAPGRLRRNAPDAIPVTVIGRISVASQSIGIGAVLVHAKSDAAKAFYLRHAEFLEYPAESRTLFLPIETLVAAFSQGTGMVEAKR